MTARCPGGRGGVHVHPAARAGAGASSGKPTRSVSLCLRPTAPGALGDPYRLAARDGLEGAGNRPSGRWYEANSSGRWVAHWLPGCSAQSSLASVLDWRLKDTCGLRQICKQNLLHTREQPRNASVVLDVDPVGSEFLQPSQLRIQGTYQ